MELKKVGKLIGLNFAIIIINVIVFSRAFLGVELSSKNPLMTAFGVTVLFISIGVFVLGNMKFLFPNGLRGKKKKLDVAEGGIQTLEHCMIAIRYYILNNIETFKSELKVMETQIPRFEKKRDTLKQILIDRFDEGGMTYNKFMGAVKSIEDIMVLKIRSVINKIEAFDEEDYEDVSKNRQHLRGSTVETRREILRQYVIAVKKTVADNEDMILKLDMLILEVSRLEDVDTDDIENLEAMQEIGKLIQDTKWYK